MLTFSVTNQGSTPVRVGVERSVLLVNGKPHRGFLRAVAEMDRSRFDNLAPGETARFHYSFGARGSIKPRDYTFVLQLGGRESAPITVQVTP